MFKLKSLTDNAINSLETINNNYLNNIKNYFNDLNEIEVYLLDLHEKILERETNIKNSEQLYENKLNEINDFKKVSVYKSLSDQLMQKDLEIDILKKRLNMYLKKENEKRNLNIQNRETGENISQEDQTSILDLENLNDLDDLDDNVEDQHDLDNNNLEEQNSNLDDNVEDLNTNLDDNVEDQHDLDNNNLEEQNSNLDDNVEDQNSNLYVENTESNNKVLVSNISIDSEAEEITFFEEEVNNKSYFFSSDNFVYKKLKNGDIGKKVIGTYTEDDSEELNIIWKRKT